MPFMLKNAKKEYTFLIFACVRYGRLNNHQALYKKLFHDLVERCGKVREQLRNQLIIRARTQALPNKLYLC